MITIRLAEKKDVPYLLPLMTQLGYPCDEEQLKKQFEVFTSFKGSGVAVACKNLDSGSSEILGWVAWATTKGFVTGQTRLRVEGLVVNECYRKQGIGKKLMAFLEDVAKQDAPTIIELTSGLRRANDGSHEFYKDLGYCNEGPMAKLYLRKTI